MSRSVSVSSETSSVQYEEEPFAQFEHHVRALCQALWSLPSEAIAVERMRGGSSSRVIRITVSGDPAREYVLRVPRFDKIRMEAELAALSFVRDNTAISVPEVIVFDLTRDNKIAGAYNIQLKLPGLRLVDAFMELSQTERMSIVSQLGLALRDMHRVRSPMPGLLDAANVMTRCYDGKFVPEVRVVDFLSKTFTGFGGEKLFGGMVDDSAKPKSTLELFIDQFNGWQTYRERLRPGHEGDGPLMERFRTVVRQMDRLGFLEGNDFVLFHADFGPQNILISKDEDGSEGAGSQPGWKISGILDWEGTSFVPYAVACLPPTWIWNSWDGDDEEDEAVLCKTPGDPEGRERKELFDSLMGPSYADHAYLGQHRFVRRLFEFARDGFTYYHRYQDAEIFFNEWEEAFGIKMDVEAVDV